MSREASPKEKWVFTKNRALTFIDQTHISDFLAWHVHSPACAVHLEPMVSVTDKLQSCWGKRPGH